jgi:hypothetical protein
MGLDPRTWFKKAPRPEGPKKIDPKFAHVPKPKYDPKANPMPTPLSGKSSASALPTPEEMREQRIREYYRDHPVTVGMQTMRTVQ